VDLEKALVKKKFRNGINGILRLTGSFTVGV